MKDKTDRQYWLDALDAARKAAEEFRQWPRHEGRWCGHWGDKDRLRISNTCGAMLEAIKVLVPHASEDPVRGWLHRFNAMSPEEQERGFDALCHKFKFVPEEKRNGAPGTRAASKE